MKINSIGQMSSGSVGNVNNNEEAAIRKQIQALRKELSDLNKSTEISEEEEQKKKEVQQQIMQLEQELQQIQAEKRTGEKQEINNDDSSSELIKEEGKGLYIDERL